MEDASGSWEAWQHLEIRSWRSSEACGTGQSNAQALAWRSNIPEETEDSQGGKEQSLPDGWGWEVPEELGCPIGLGRSSLTHLPTNSREGNARGVGLSIDCFIHYLQNKTI